MQITTQPISAIIPTAYRPDVLRCTLLSLSEQNVQPDEIIIIDASNNDETMLVCNEGFEGLRSKIVYRRAIQKGAATQRNEGMAIAANDFIFFCDDDILFEPFCMERLWAAINSDTTIGGVNAMITNQRYLKPGKITNALYHFMNGEKLSTYAGKCLGPAWNLLPEDDDTLPDYYKVDWLNLGSTIYRKEALPNPVFPVHFKGYSMMEDLTLSSIVGRNWQLYNVRTARIFHDSQPGAHKSNIFELSKMESVNRYYIMTFILGRNTFKDHLKLLVFETFSISARLTSLKGFKQLPSILSGKISALIAILTNRNIAR
jgi:glycosyltransferase involved in cell wall biosynthesis